MGNAAWTSAYGVELVGWNAVCDESSGLIMLPIRLSLGEHINIIIYVFICVYIIPSVEGR